MRRPQNRPPPRDFFCVGDPMDLQTTPISKLFFRYAIPSVISMLGIAMYVLADTWFIANGIGMVGLTSLNISIPVFSLINGTGLLIGIGSATVYALYRGRRNPAASGLFTQGLILGGLASLVFMAAGLFLVSDIAWLLGASDASFPDARIYMQICMLFSPLFIGSNLLLAFVRNDGAPRLAMAAMLTGTLFNIVVDYILIIRLDMGMLGAGLATGFAPLVSALLLCLHFVGGRSGFGLQRVRLRQIPLMPIAKGGVTSLITELSAGFVIITFNLTFLYFLGDVGIAAYGVITNIAFVIIAVFVGIGQGIQPLASNNFGAGRLDRCHRVLLWGVASALALGALFYGAGALYAPQIVRQFNPDGVASMQVVATEGIRIYFIGFLFAGINIVVASYFQAILSSRSTIWISLTRGFFALLAGLALLSTLFGARGIWMTVPFAEGLTFCLVLWLYRRHRRFPPVIPPVRRKRSLPQDA